MINFGDTGYFVRYIQVFLKENYNPSLFVSGTYDSDTHSDLIKYLSQPNVERIQVMHQLIMEKFNIYNDYGNLVEGIDKYFDYIASGDTIRYYTRNVTASKINYIYNNIDDIDKFVREHGWRITERPNLNMEDLDTIQIVISPESRINYFPTQDLLYMVNQFCNDYMYGYAIRDGRGYDDQVHVSNNYKLAIIPCNPGEVYTITHGYSVPTEIVVGASTTPKADIEEDLTTVTNTIDRREGEQGKLSAGSSITYTIPTDCYSLIIQMPYNKDANFTNNTKVKVLIGDVNQDGLIDKADRDLLSAYLQGDLGYKLEGLQLIAANCYIDYDSKGNPKIDNRDLAYLDEYLAGTRMLGVAYYDMPYSNDNNEINKLLVVKGDVTSTGKDSSINVPVDEYYKSPWAVHECFLPYIARLCITPYSLSDDIAYAQNLVDHVIGTSSIRASNTAGVGTETEFDKTKSGNYVRMATGFFDEEYDREHSVSFKGTMSLRDIIKEYQVSAKLMFALGYMDLNTELSMRNNLVGIDVDLYSLDIDNISDTLRGDRDYYKT